MEDNSNFNIAIGTVINERYVILEFIAKGGMGEVYRAHQINLKRDVAIKIISKEWLESIEDNEMEMETGLQRFRNEVQAMAQVRHPNILQIYDFGSFSIEKEEKHSLVEYISMEYVPGGTLRSTMSEDGFYAEEDLTREWLIKYFLPVLEGVEALHKANIIHRDLKPSNVLMDGKVPKIADFGLARFSGFKPVTQSVDVKGTPAYMSPEHFQDLRRTDHRADIYSLGKILFEAIDGRITSKTIPFKQAGLPNPEAPFFKRLDQIIQEATVGDREKRLESVELFRSALLEVVDDSKKGKLSVITSPYRYFFSFTHPKWIWTGIAVALFSVAAMIVWHLTGESGDPRKITKTSQILLPGPSEQADSDPTDGEAASHANMPQTILGQDGITMHLIPDGLQESGPKKRAGLSLTAEVPPFYMDETKITVHHFAEFLNNVKDTLTIEKGLVKRDGEIWFLLGQGTDPQDQIIYGHERFLLRDPENAARPVVRVSWYGATAYAKHYGERLPTVFEWELAARTDKLDKPFPSNKKERTSHPMEEGKSSGNMEDIHMNHMGSNVDSLHGINNEVPGRTGISESRGREANIKEWIVKVKDDQVMGKPPLKGQESAGYSSLVIGKSSPSGDSATQKVTSSFRYPWEGFFDVGFRCVVNIPPKSDKP